MGNNSPSDVAVAIREELYRTVWPSANTYALEAHEIIDRHLSALRDEWISEGMKGYVAIHENDLAALREEVERLKEEVLCETTYANDRQSRLDQIAERTKPLGGDPLLRSTNDRAIHDLATGKADSGTCDRCNGTGMQPAVKVGQDGQCCYCEGTGKE